MSHTTIKARPFAFADWQDGQKPPKGWDAADAVRDGWSKADLDGLMRASARPWTPPPREAASTNDRPASISEPIPREPLKRSDNNPTSSDKSTLLQVTGAPPIGSSGQRPMGVDGVGLIPRIYSVVHGSEVELASIMATKLSSHCGGKVVRAEGRFWAFGPTAWAEIPDQKLRLAVHGFDGATVGDRQMLKIGKRTIDGVLNEVGTILAAPCFFDNPTVGVNASNGVITIDDSGRVNVRPHDPDDRFRFTIEAGFHLHSEMSPSDGSMLHRLITGAFCGDPDAEAKINLVGEILGAAAFGLATWLPHPKAFVFLGETASNGKSTIASLLSCLLPAGSVSSIPPSAFGDERRIINLAGKAANVADELSAAAIAGETFKAAVTGDPIEGRDLYRSAMTFMPRALHCFTTNTLPRFNGGIDRGLQRRLVVLRFNRQIPESEIVPDIAQRIQRNEMELLLGFAVSGAQRLVRNRAYTTPTSSKEALHAWLLLDPLNEWFDARIIATESEPHGGWPATGKLFADFKQWALEQGHVDRFLPPINTFSQRLKAFPNVQIKRLSRGSVAAGIKIEGSTDW